MMSAECKKRLFKGATNWIQTISWKTEAGKKQDTLEPEKKLEQHETQCLGLTAAGVRN